MSVDYKETISGAFGALCCAYSGNPFDVVKIRLQTQKTGVNQQYQGVIDCLLKICKEEGILALWKGVTPALSSALLENSVLFSVNGMLKRLYVSVVDGTGGEDNLSRPFTTLESAMLGGAGGFCSATCITPLEVIKCRTQVETGRAAGPLSKLISCYYDSGLKGMFRGWSATVCRDVPFTFFFFGGYEAMTYLLQRSQSNFVCTSNVHSSDRDKLNAFGIYLAGGSAGAFAWGVAFPLDSIKSFMQTYQPSGCRNETVSFRDAFVYIYQKRGGITGFYGGWTAAVLRAFPANAGLFLGYEFALDVLSCV